MYIIRLSDLVITIPVQRSLNVKASILTNWYIFLIPVNRKCRHINVNVSLWLSVMKDNTDANNRGIVELTAESMSGTKHT